MATDWNATLKEVKKNSALLQQANPGMLNAFGAVRTASHSENAIDAKTRELIAVAVAVSRQCEPCLASHVMQAKQAGASKEEIGAAVGVAMAIATGSSYIYSLKALDAYEQF